VKLTINGESQGSDFVTCSSNRTNSTGTDREPECKPLTFRCCPPITTRL
jgi:hypothetical protein